MVAAERLPKYSRGVKDVLRDKLNRLKRSRRARDSLSLKSPLDSGPGMPTTTSVRVRLFSPRLRA